MSGCPGCGRVECPGPGSPSCAGSASSWKAVDLAGVVAGLVDGTLERPRPDLLTTDAGDALLYRSRVNALWGESTAGKTWVALLAARAELAAGRPVVYVDLEDHEIGLVGRLLALGTTPAAITAGLRYVHPEAAPTAAELAHVHKLAADAGLVVVDSVGEWLGVCGLSSNSDDEVARWTTEHVRPLARGGAAVVLLDHVPHASDGLVRAIGSQRKRAGIDGAAYMVTAVEPMGLGVRGLSSIITAKDRNGYRPTRSVAAEFVLDATGDAHVAELRSAGSTADAEAAQRQTALTRRIAEYLAEADEPRSGRQVCTDVTGDDKRIRAALHSGRGWLFDATPGPSNSERWSLSALGPQWLDGAGIFGQWGAPAPH